MKDKKIAVIIPTYNERENIIPLIKELLKLPLNIRIFIVDDNSPDGTGDVVKKHFSENSSVNVFIREGRRGRGLAGIFGYKKAIEAGSDVIGEMDGDFSHHPEFIPEMIRALEKADVVIGSRFLKEGGEERKNFIRKCITKFAHFYLRIILGIKLTDPTSGFRFFKRKSLEKIVRFLKAEDPFIVTEVIFYLNKEKVNIIEVPIVFSEREKGESKLKYSTLLKYLFKVIKLRCKLKTKN